MKKSLRIGTRGSELALAQSREVAANIERTHAEVACELVSVVTSGDKKQNAPESANRDKKDWIFELEQGLVAREIDIAVHSAKDVPIDIHPDTVLIPILKREEPWDVLLLKNPMPNSSLADLRPGLVVGTSSLRRAAQIRWLRSDLQILPLRGNVPTRIEKLRHSSFDAIVLAKAGLLRLGLLAPQAVTLYEITPAVNQGILVAQVLRSSADILGLIEALQDPPTSQAFDAERKVIEVLKADCHSAVSVHAALRGSELELNAEVYAQDASIRLFEKLAGSPNRARELGELVGEALLAKGAADLL